MKKFNANQHQISLKIFAVCAIISLISSIEAVTNKATIWRQWNNKQNKYHYIITCSDIHKSMEVCLFGDFENKQIEGIKKLVQDSNQETLFLVEDMGSYSANNENIKNTIPKRNAYLENNEYSEQHGLLFGLVNFILSKGKSAKNLECRFFCYKLLGSPLFYPDNVSSGYSDSIFKLCASEILNTYNHIEKQHNLSLKNATINPIAIKHYQDFYEGILTQLKEFKKNIDLINSPNFSIKQYFKDDYEPKDELAPIVGALSAASFRAPDINAMQVIINEHNYNKIFIFMGESHIYNIDLFLSKNGYEKIIECGNYALEKFYDNEFKCFDNITATPNESFDLSDLIKNVNLVDPKFFIACLNEELTSDLFLDIQ